MNFGSVCVLIVLIAIVALIIRGMIKDKKAGKSITCGDCKCESCHDGGTCPSSQMTLDMAKALEQEFGHRGDQGEKKTNA